MPLFPCYKSNAKVQATFQVIYIHTSMHVNISRVCVCACVRVVRNHWHRWSFVLSIESFRWHNHCGRVKRAFPSVSAWRRVRYFHFCLPDNFICELLTYFCRSMECRHRFVRRIFSRTLNDVWIFLIQCKTTRIQTDESWCKIPYSQEQNACIPQVWHKSLEREIDGR